MDRPDNHACDETQPRPLPAFDDQAPPDRYCDLILTGGVTSAAAYPSTIFALAGVYRFRSLGGSSSGAGSAALAAAAEYRRRHGSTDGFRLLLSRSAEVADVFGGKTGLAWLFQPGRYRGRLFKVLVNAVAGPEDKTRRLAAEVAKAYLLAPLLFALALGVLGVLVMAWGGLTPRMSYVLGVVVGATMIAIVLGLTLWRFWRDLRCVLDENYGLCTGLTSVDDTPRPQSLVERPQRPALTDWLHAFLQETAGLRLDGPPLTFADLAAAPGSPQATRNTSAAGDDESIRLQMVASNLTLGRPWVFPVADAPKHAAPGAGEPDLYFLERDMRRLFPASVVDHMVTVSAPLLATPFDPVHRYDPATGSAAIPFYRLPGKRLPVLVAARMSVSFPLLFEAVPLWMCHAQHSGGPQMRRCLFADGGLCSNFPIHLFDSALPDWPTFGVALRDLIPNEKHETVQQQLEAMKKSIELPLVYENGPVHDVWRAFDEERKPITRLTNLLSALLATVREWNDATLAHLPGVRERVVRVGLSRGIGGLNILMSPAQIRALGVIGGEAARRLLQRYAAPDRPDGLAQGWAEHRWVRFNILREALTEVLDGLRASASGGRFNVALEAQIRAAIDDAPLAASPELRASEAAALQGVLGALVQTESALRAADATPQPYRAKPRPLLRIRPPL